jgi:hypothetical protein
LGFRVQLGIGGRPGDNPRVSGSGPRKPRRGQLPRVSGEDLLRMSEAIANLECVDDDLNEAFVEVCQPWPRFYFEVQRLAFLSPAPGEDIPSLMLDHGELRADFAAAEREAEARLAARRVAAAARLARRANGVLRPSFPSLPPPSAGVGSASCQRRGRTRSPRSRASRRASRAARGSARDGPGEPEPAGPHLGPGWRRPNPEERRSLASRRQA